MDAIYSTVLKETTVAALEVFSMQCAENLDFWENYMKPIDSVLYKLEMAQNDKAEG